jgi:RecA/RadA recombinase
MNLLSTGSTLLNLALTDTPNGGYAAGRYFFLVGDSNSGKTFLSMTCGAEATISETFKNYRIIYDNIEDGMLMNLDTLFSEEMADKVEPPEMVEGNPVFSDTAESFYYHLDDAIYQAGWDPKKKQPSGVDDPRPFIYVLDSESSLDSESAEKKFYQHKDAYQKNKEPKEGEEGNGKKVAGSYGDGKAKKHSESLRHAMKGLRQTNSILIVISQTRQNITGYGPAKTRAGGEALRFYAHAEIWSSVVEPIKKTVHDIDRKVGTRIKLEMKKNRITGKLHDVVIDIFPSYGIDDLGTCVDYLVEEGFWTQIKQTINAKGLDIVGTREKIIRTIERRGLEDKLRELCGECWAAVEEACALPRKNRYQTAQVEETE